MVLTANYIKADVAFIWRYLLERLCFSSRLLSLLVEVSFCSDFLEQDSKKDIWDYTISDTS